MNALFESSYDQFHCTGADCEDTCCRGWHIHIDQATYHRYKNNRHPALKDVLKDAVKRNDDAVGDIDYALLVMSANGYCHFFDQGLCRIHTLLGEQALSNVCATFPRIINEFGAQLEYSLDLSCPEAARLVLLDRTGVGFIEREAKDGGTGGAKSFQRQYKVELDPEHTNAVNEIRALVIFVLQYREVSLETRLLMLGLLLESVDKILLPLSGETVGKVPEIITQARQLLAGAQELENQLGSIESNDTLKLKVFAEMLRALEKQTSSRFTECVHEASKGFHFQISGVSGERELAQRISSAFESHYLPFLSKNPHVFENYLVHSFFQCAFPFGTGEPLIQYRQLVFSFFVIKLVLLGMAAYHRDMTEEMVVRVIQSFSRYSRHNSNYLPRLINVLEENRLHGFRDLFLLIVDRPLHRTGSG